MTSNYGQSRLSPFCLLLDTRDFFRDVEIPPGPQVKEENGHVALVPCLVFARRIHRVAGVLHCVFTRQFIRVLALAFPRIGKLSKFILNRVRIEILFSKCVQYLRNCLIEWDLLLLSRGHIF